MKKILANDGIDATGKELLEKAGFIVDTNNIPQEELASKLNAYDAILVRSATKVRKDLIDQCPNIKLIGRGGVGMDNIDVEYAKSKGVEVINTPAASSQAVAELAFGHFLSIARFIHDSNKNMPVSGDSNFNGLKKKYAEGIELTGRTLGVLGFGRIGQHAAKVGLGLGMNILAVDPYTKEATISVKVADQVVNVPVKTVSMDEMLKHSDFITLHVPFTGAPVLGKEEFAKMKDGVIIANASRGGTIDEDALLEALNSGKVFGIGLDVFDNEPTPRKDLLVHPKVSATPHIGASTTQAQLNIGTELSEKIIAFFS